MIKIVVFALLSLFTAACAGGGSNSANREITSIAQNGNNRIEVIYFHGKNRCITCNAIESHTKEVVETLYSEQLKDSSIIFKSVDISLAENKILAQKYEVSWSSLFINKFIDGKEDINNLTELGFMYAKNSPDKFKEEVKSVIESLINN